MKTTQRAFSFLATSTFAAATLLLVSPTFAQTSKMTTTMAPIEQFKVCKNMAVSAVYELGKTTKEGVIAASLDYNTRMNGELKQAKQKQLNSAIEHVSVSKNSKTNREAAASELFTALDFYLMKDNTVNLDKVNAHLSQGKIVDVAVSCQDKVVLKNSNLLGVGEQETTHPVLFSQKI